MASRLLHLLTFLFMGFALAGQSNPPKVSLKFGKGLQIVAGDSSMALKTSCRFQNLFVTEKDLEKGAEWESSFQIRRARLKFEGWAFNPNLRYYMQLGLSGSDMSNALDANETGNTPKLMLDAYLKYRLHKNLEILVGQAILPGNRERVISSQKMQFVDRSRVNAHFNLDRDMGVQLFGKFHYGTAVIKPIFAWSLGEGRNVVRNIGGFDYTGRLEVLPFGEFSDQGDYFESDLSREQKPKLAMGITFNFNQDASRQQQAGNFLKDSLGQYMLHDLQTVYTDLLLKYKGFSFHTEFAHKKVADMGSPDGDANPMKELIDANGRSYLTGHGFMAQAGYLFKNNWEVALRYGQVSPDFQRAFTAEKEYTLGISKYLYGHNLKIQSDLGLIHPAGDRAKSLRCRIQFEFAI